jgi:hypothetical protein
MDTNRIKATVINDALIGPGEGSDTDDIIVDDSVFEMKAFYRRGIYTESQDAIMPYLFDAINTGTPVFIHSKRRSGKTWLLLRFIYKLLRSNTNDKHCVLFATDSRKANDLAYKLNKFFDRKLEISESYIDLYVNPKFLSEDEFDVYRANPHNRVNGTRLVNPLTNLEVFIARMVLHPFEIRSFIFYNRRLVTLFDEYCFMRCASELHKIREFGYEFNINVIAISTIPKQRPKKLVE